MKRSDVELGLEINRALVERDADRLILAVAEFMTLFDMAAEHSLVKKLPTRNS